MFSLQEANHPDKLYGAFFFTPSPVRPAVAQLARARNSEASAADVVSSGVWSRAGADLRGGVQRLRNSRGRETGEP